MIAMMAFLKGDFEVCFHARVALIAVDVVEIQ